MRILVIGGMHGNEPLGIELVQLFKSAPMSGVDAVLANPDAVTNAMRYTTTDLNRSFPGDKTSKSYEARRAAELVELCSGYDLVLDFHNTHCPDNDCSFIGEGAVPELRNVSSYLGLPKVVIADYDCLNKYAPNCISIEVSLSSPECSAHVWYERISALAALSIADVPSGRVETYRFVYRMTLQDRDRLLLDQLGLQAFKPIPDTVADAMGVSAPAYPIFIGDEYTPYNYGGLLNKLY